MRNLIDRAFWILLAAIVGASIYFTLDIARIKKSMNASAANLRIETGQKVTVKKIIDGDEVLVEMGNKKFIVRILGISSFDSTLNDPLDKGAGEAALFYLQKMILNNEIELAFDEFKVDSSERLLSYIHMSSVDIGEDMVSEGLTLAFTKYPFSRINKYEKAQRAAREMKKGIWGNARLEKRALDLLNLWMQDREQPR
ncbi:MAG: hypothetical protein EPN93_07870 [Spirochaetes bacterium]|nr:MAG: hypothetical protein EPN93_07870 [Spirochaetota bacterium]